MGRLFAIIDGRHAAASPRNRRLLAVTVALLEMLLTFGLIAFVNRTMAENPLQAALALLIGAAALSLLAYVLLHRELLLRLRHLKSGLTAEQVARTAAEEQADEKSRLLATMTHEIRTPLNGVIGMLGLLLETDLTSEQRNYATTAHGSGRILLSIIDEILDGAKSEALNKGDAAPIDIVALVENVTELLAPRAQAKGISIVSLFEEGVPATVRGNDMRLRQVLFNLAGNAIKFTETGGVTITVRRDGPAGLAFEVSDTGIGMSEEELERLFKPFGQANDTTTRRYGGTGLGLVISRRIAETMGGSLTVTSAPGTGTCFRADIPGMVEADAPAPLPLAGRRFRLALSDDFVAGHFARQLQLQGATTQRLADTQASPALFANALDAIVCDASLGPAILLAARRIRKQGKPLPQIWIILTPEERRQLKSHLRAPLTGYLMQPVRCSTLVDQLTARDSAFIRTASAQLRTIATRARPVQGLRVLVADDSPVNTVIARTMLQKAGHAVTAVASGEAVLAALAGNSVFDILLLDMEMPGLSGPETAMRIRAGDAADPARNRLPILALTANTRPEAVEACLTSGMDGHLSKPFERQDLEQAVGRLGRARAA
ncbi:MAG: ATP-binding protein [Hyphomicrobiales bacterium]